MSPQFRDHGQHGFTVHQGRSLLATAKPKVPGSGLWLLKLHGASWIDGNEPLPGSVSGTRRYPNMKTVQGRAAARREMEALARPASGHAARSGSGLRNHAP